jgi:hypothetical protein
MDEEKMDRVIETVFALDQVDDIGKLNTFMGCERT